MKEFYRIIVCGWMMLIITFTGGYSLAGNVSLPESLLTDDYVYEYTFTDYDKAVRIMKELRKRETFSQYRLDITEGDLYFNTGRYLLALKYYKRVMRSDSVRNNDKNYMEQVHRMISCYDCLHDERKKAHYVELLLQKAERCDNMEMKSIALFNMGKMIYYQEDKPRGYQLIKEAIGLMKQTDYKYKYDNLRYDYNTLLIMQQRDKCYEDALQTLEELEKIVLEAFNEEPGIGRLMEKEKKTMYAHRAVILSRLGRIGEADRAYRSWETIGEAYTKDDYLITPYLMDRKMYDKVIEMYTLRGDFLYENEDTVNYHMMSVKRSLGKAYEGKGNYRQAARYFEALAILTDSLKTREQQSSAIELATIYETGEKDTQILKQAADLRLRNTLVISLSSIVVLVFILLWRSIHNTRVVKAKNMVLVDHVNSLIVCKDELQKVRNELRRMTGNPAVKEKTEETVEPDNEQSKVQEANRKLFMQLEQTIIDKRLYLSPELSRDELAQTIGVNKNRFAEIIQENTGMNLTAYLNNLRLNYALQLLKAYPNYTLQAIATDSGFNNMGTFHRLFKEKVGMTPSEYKSISLNKNN